MWQYALKRTAGLIPVLFVAVLLTFIAIQFVPGDPIQVMLSDHSGNVELEERLREAYGLDKPLVVQFTTYLGNIFSGTFGLSYRYTNQTVWEVIKPSLYISPVIAVSALIVALPIGIFLGVFAALRRNSWADTAVILFLVTGISIPNFALGSFLMYLVAVNLGLLPVAGWGTPSHLVLPVIVLAVAPAAYIARLTRTYMLEVLQNDYIRTARAKGLKNRLVVYRHALRNALVPLLTTIGLIFGGLLSGTFVVEKVFNIPGLGSLAIDSIFARDYPVVMTVVLLFTLFYSIINLIVDLLYAVVDPRIRYTD
ncbi:MAG: ABC transporter permease [Desulfobulbaceae bacterium]|nr:ABC transporter permease [Desulfobulbaceae bacterium]